MPAAPPTIPPSVLDQVLRVMRERGDATALRAVQRARGGLESTSVRLTTGRRSYFLKWNASPTHSGYRAEVESLALLARSGAVAVPEILAAVDRGDGAGHEIGFLLQEWLSPPNQQAFLHRVGRELGAAIARMHRARALGDQPSPLRATGRRALYTTRAPGSPTSARACCGRRRREQRGTPASRPQGSRAWSDCWGVWTNGSAGSRASPR